MSNVLATNKCRQPQIALCSHNNDNKSRQPQMIGHLHARVIEEYV